MYKKYLCVDLNETKAKITNNVQFYLNDIGTSVLKIMIRQGGKPYAIDTDNDKFRVILAPVSEKKLPPVPPCPPPFHRPPMSPCPIPPQPQKEEVEPILQDDQALVKVLTDKTGVVEITLNSEIMGVEGQGMYMNVEMYNDDGDVISFAPFQIDIIKNLQD